MTPQQAIDIVLQVQANWVANGTDHQNLSLAIQTLQTLVAREHTKTKN